MPLYVFLQSHIVVICELGIMDTLTLSSLCFCFSRILQLTFLNRKKHPYVTFHIWIKKIHPNINLEVIISNITTRNILSTSYVF